MPFVSPDLNAVSTQRVCSASVSVNCVYVLCLSLEVLCVKCKVRMDSYKIVRTAICEKADVSNRKMYCFIDINAFVSNALLPL